MTLSDPFKMQQIVGGDLEAGVTMDHGFHMARERDDHFGKRYMGKVHKEYHLFPTRGGMNHIRGDGNVCNRKSRPPAPLPKIVGNILLIRAQPQGNFFLREPVHT